MKSHYIKLKPNQVITLIPNSNATITQAIFAAMDFCSKNNCKYVDLIYNGYTLGIDAESDVRLLVADYDYYLNIKK